MQVMCVRMSKEASVAGAAWTTEGHRDEVRDPRGPGEGWHQLLYKLADNLRSQREWSTMTGF